MTSAPTSTPAAVLPTAAASTALKRKHPSRDALSNTHLFRPYRSIGHITSSLPFHYHPLGTARFLLVPLHHSFLVYNLDRLRVTLTSQPVNEQLTAIAAAGRDVTVVGAGRCAVFL